MWLVKGCYFLSSRPEDAFYESSTRRRIFRDTHVLRKITTYIRRSQASFNRVTSL